MQVAAYVLPHGIGKSAHLHAYCHEVFQQAMYAQRGISIHVRHMASDRYRPQLQGAQELPELVHLQVSRL